MTKILIVDDAEGIRRMLVRQLRKLTYETLAVEGGREALDLLRSERADLVLLDQMMPGMDGLETVERIRKEISSHLPVIMLTAHGSLHLAVTFMKAGGADFIEKPIDIDILETKIRQALKTAKLQQKLRKQLAANEQLKERDRIKSEFVANVSHELRTPLTSIKSFTGILMEDYLNNFCKEKALRYLKIIDRESDRLTRLINNLLDLGKIEKSEDIWNDEEVDMSDLLRKTIDEIASSGPESAPSITCEVTDNIPIVTIDRDRIMQVIQNLIFNAIKFSEEGGEIRTKIEVLNNPEGFESGRYLVVSVADDGIGISPDDHEKIFGRFQRIDSAFPEKRDGVGLGLAICKEIVEHYGGRIWVESELGKGATFYFAIPIRDGRV